ncbi:MAG TPA: two-component regulator propeller domain-containing protein [Dokdonella sp.]
MRRQLASSLFAFALVASAHAGPPPAPPQFVPLTVADGLPSDHTYKIAQDRAGFIWVGTRDGLARYDGVGFRIYRHDPADPASLPSNDVSTIFVDHAGALWCGGESSGLNRLEADGSGFRHWMHRPNELGTLGSNDLFAITEDASGAIWVGTYLGGLNRLQDDGSFLHVDHDAEDPASLRSSTVQSLYADARDRLWIGTDVGLDVREADGRIVHVELPPMAARSGPPMVMTLLPESDGSVLVGTLKGLFRVDAELRYAGEIDGGGSAPLSVIALVRANDGTLWIGLRRGLARLDARGLQRYSGDEPTPGSYPGARTMDVFGDAEGGLWFATADGGVARLPPHWRNFTAFRHVAGDPASLTHRSVQALGVDAAGAVWAAGGNDGLDRIDPASGAIERWSARLGIRGTLLTQVLPDDAGRLWVGSQEGLGVYALDPPRQLVALPVDLMRADALPPGFVDQLRRAPDRSIWASSHGGGVARLAPDPPRVVARYTPSAKTLGDSDVTELVLDGSATPWLATASGVERYAADQDRFVDVAELPHEPIDGLAFAPDGSLWLHRLGALERYRLDGGVRLEQRLDAAAGWPPMTAAALAVSADGGVWVTSPRGLWHVDARSAAIRRFDSSDGLPSPEFLAGALAAAPDGTLYAGTLAGVVAFDPAALQLDSAPPVLRVTALGVRRDGRVLPLDPARPIELRYDDLNFRVEARVLSYANPAANRYRFKLDGFDPDWVDAPRGERVYSRLAPGTYRLKLRAANADGAWTDYAAPLAIHVASPPWATPGAYAAYALGAALLAWAGFVGYRARVRRRHAFALAEERRRSAEQLTEAKSQFFATIGHEIRTPMTGVLGMSELLLATPLDARQRSYAQAIHQSGALLLRLVNDSLDLARIDAGKLALDDEPLDPAAIAREVAELQQPLAARKDLAISVRVGDGVPERIWGDAVRIKQILLNLVNNALKFTERGGVSIELSPLGPQHLRIRVADTGPGMSAEVCARLFNRFEQAEGVLRRHGGSGLGLAICRELTLLMGGTISVSSTLGEGSVFDVDLPVYAAPGRVRERAVAPASPRRALDVLLVEDDATVAEVVAGLLRGLGHRTTHVSNGLAALTELRSARYDLALLDLDLPGIDGLKLAQLIRSAESDGARLPLIAVTARSVGDEEQRVRAAGIDLLLRKPVTSAMLAAALAAVESTTAAPVVA